MYAASDLLAFINSKTGKKYSTRSVGVSAPFVAKGAQTTEVTLTAKNSAYGFTGAMNYRYNRVILSSIKVPSSRAFTITSGRPISDIFSQLKLIGWTADFDELKNEIITLASLTKVSKSTGTYSLQAKAGSYLYEGATSIIITVQ